MLFREMFFRILPHLYHKNAIVITGMRQVGKTTLMRQLFDEFQGKKLWFDFDNPLDSMLFEHIDYNYIHSELLRSANAGEEERLLVCIDEIQNFPEITKIIKYLIDHYSVKFIITGSSNFYLRNLFPESLSGRKFLYVLPVLSFSEFLHFNGKLDTYDLEKNIDNSLRPRSKYEIIKQRGLYDLYLEYGGFPEVVLSSDEETKKMIIKNIFASFFEKDIKVFSELKQIRELRDLILLLAPRNGNMLDISKISSELGINRVKLYDYLEFLQGTFFMHLLPKFSHSLDRSVAGGRKVYFSDTGILNQIAKVTSGHLLETAVANQLRYYGDLSFYNKRNTAEIDFILDKKIAFEVKQKAVMADLRKLKKLSDSLNLQKVCVLCLEYTDLDEVGYPYFL